MMPRNSFTTAQGGCSFLEAAKEAATPVEILKLARRLQPPCPSSRLQLPRNLQPPRCTQSLAPKADAAPWQLTNGKISLGIAPERRVKIRLGPVPEWLVDCPVTTRRRKWMSGSPHTELWHRVDWKNQSGHCPRRVKFLKSVWAVCPNGV